ncbi:hypothetical protein KY345_04580 [Candidatus Woesearchaeota archaeon]|nr:hypothetical protein [Candidatus Woesearchaeota archaeon]
MKDVLRKVALFGVGVAAMSRDQVDKFVKQLEKKKIINVKEGKKLVNDILKQSEKNRKKIQAEIDKQVKLTLKKIPLATKQDLANLEKKLKKRK